MISQRHLVDLSKAFKALHNLSHLISNMILSKPSTQAIQVYSPFFLETPVLCYFKVSAHAIPLVWNPLPHSLFL